MQIGPTAPLPTDWPDEASVPGMTGSPRRPWNAAEDERLRALCGEGRSQREIGRLLGRAVSSVGCRIRVLAIPLHRPEPRPRPCRRPQWPADLRYEDDPRAPRREPPWRGPAPDDRSITGCAAAMIADQS